MPLSTTATSLLCAHGLTPTACYMCVADAAAHTVYLTHLHCLLNSTPAGDPWFTTTPPAPTHHSSQSSR